MWVGLSKDVSDNQLETIAQSYFEPESVAVSREFPEDDWPDVFAHLDKNDSEFPLLLNFYRLSGDEEQQHRTCIRFARYLSEEIGCRTICDGSGFGDDDSPYWSIIWDNGVSFLADDGGTTFGDGEPDKPVTVVRKIEVKT